MKQTTLFLLTLLISSTLTCFTVGTDETVDQIAYVDLRANSISESPGPTLDGYLYTNFNETRSRTLRGLVFTMYKIEEIDFLGGVDLSIVFDEAEANGFDGVIVAFTDQKVVGESMYFYYNDDTPVSLYVFEIRTDVFDELADRYPNGADFTIFPSDECDPYSNYWQTYYNGAIFHILWVLLSGFAFAVFIITILALVKNWSTMLMIFKFTLVLHLLASFIRIIYGLTFMIAKQYRQGPAVFFFQSMDVIGSVGTFSLSLAAVAVYVSYWQVLTSGMSIDFGKATRIPTLVASITMCVLAAIGIFFLLVASNAWMYYICYIFFILLLFSTTFYYIYTTVKLTSILSENVKKMGTGNNVDRKKNIRKLRVEFLIQGIVLIIVILASVSTVVNYSPIQNAGTACFLHYGLTYLGLVHALKFLEEKTKGSKTTKTKSNTQKN